MPRNLPQNLHVSFEFFPPRSEKARARLDAAMERLKHYGPRFVTVTYGAGGSTSAGTLEAVVHLSRTFGIETASHLTFVATPMWEVTTYARRLRENGIRHVVALRGDPPKGGRRDLYGGAGFFRSTPAFITAIRQIGDFEISVAAYPEKHPDAPTLEADIDMLALKCESGASRAITQFFFDNDLYWRFLERVRARGIAVPVVPGILPVLDYDKMRQFARMCGATVPAAMASRFEALEQPEDRLKLAGELVCEQVSALAQGGVTAYHFFTLNDARLPALACDCLGLDKAQGRQGRDHRAA